MSTHADMRATSVRDVPAPKGRGVFAERKITTGELLDEAPVVVYPAGNTGHPALDHYCFWWSDTEWALAFGRISLVNHAEHSNCRIELDHERRTIRLYATRAIAAGEEVTFTYGCDLWFDVAE